MVKWVRLVTIVLALLGMGAGVFILDAQHELKQACRAYELRDMDQAMRHARRAHFSGKNDNKIKSRALNLQYNIAVRLGHPKTAIEILNRAIRIDPRCGLCYLRRGDLKYGQEKFVAARDDFKTGFETISSLKPATQAYYYARQGLSLLAVGDTEHALTAARNALQLDPESPLAFFLRSKIQDSLGDLDGAHESVLEAYRLGRKQTGFFSSPEGDRWLRYYADVRIRYSAAHRE
jgi:tetratricopeptide (TPR) repeat protein